MMMRNFIAVVMASIAFLCIGKEATRAQQLDSGEDARSTWQNPGSEPRELVTAGSFVFFSAEDGVHGRELWRTDGTPEGTQLAFDIWRGPQNSDPVALTAVKNRVFFCADMNLLTNRTRLWVSDGSSDGTREVRGAGDSPLTIDRAFAAKLLAAAGDRLYFGLQLDPSMTWVCATDGVTQTVLPHPQPEELEGPTRIGQLLACGEKVFATISYNTWVQDRQPTADIYAFDVQSNGTSHAYLGLVTVEGVMGHVGNRMIFRARDAEGKEGFEPWVSDGTPEGTHILKDLVPGPEGSFDINFDYAALGGLVYFRGTDPEHGAELWVTDGTSEGTRLVKDIVPGSAGSELGILAATESRLFFQANDGIHGRELWVSDGTPEGTNLARDISPGPLDSKPFRLQAVGELMYFTAEERSYGGELWVSDGTEKGTRLVKDIVPGPDSSWPYFKAALGDRLVFTANDGLHGIELWVTDGTEQGTFQLKDIYPTRGANPSSDPQELTAVGKLVFFVINDARNGAELWRSDGSHDGTVLVKDIFPGPASSRPSQLIAFNNRLFFQAEDSSHGLELWTSDGTEQGTYLAADINLGPPSSSPHGFLVVDDSLLLFVATETARGEEIVVLDTTMNIQFLDIRPGEESSHPKRLTLGRDESHATCVYFVADDGIHGDELWMWNRTAPPSLVRDILTNAGRGSNPSQLTATDNGLFFSADDGAKGIELYRTEGIGASTNLVKDAVTGNGP